MASTKQKVVGVAVALVALPVVGFVLLYVWLAGTPSGIEDVRREHEEKMAAALGEHATVVTPATVSAPMPTPAPTPVRTPQDEEVLRQLDALLQAVDHGVFEVSVLRRADDPANRLREDPPSVAENTIAAYQNGRAGFRSITRIPPDDHATREAVGRLLNEKLDEAESRKSYPYSSTGILAIARACVQRDDARARELLEKWNANPGRWYLVTQTPYPTSQEPFKAELTLLVTLADLPYLPEGFLDEYEKELMQLEPQMEAAELSYADIFLKNQEDLAKGRVPAQAGNPSLLYFDGVFDEMRLGVVQGMARNQFNRFCTAWLRKDAEEAWAAALVIKRLGLEFELYYGRTLPARYGLPNTLTEMKWYIEAAQVRPTSRDRDFLRLVVAAAKYRREQGAWPERLDERVPRYIETSRVTQLQVRDLRIYQPKEAILFSRWSTLDNVNEIVSGLQAANGGRVPSPEQVLSAAPDTQTRDDWNSRLIHVTPRAYFVILSRADIHGSAVINSLNEDRLNVGQPRRDVLEGKVEIDELRGVLPVYLLLQELGQYIGLEANE